MLILVTENQLDDWVRGHAQEAQGLIVELVWRLVAASCPRPLERRFPLSDSIGQHGPDGVLKVTLAFAPFVPEGSSIWEIGTGLRPGDKATSDYNDRTADTPEEVRRESAFVFVTPLSGRLAWEHTWKEDAQASWVQERRSRGEWKDVQVIDGTKLIDWLHQFPAVELWLAQSVLRLPVQQIETPEQRWKILRAIGGPPFLTPDVFLANRDEAYAKLSEVFNDALVQLTLTTRFPDQAVGFVCAYLASLADETRIDAVGRCLIVSGIEAWNVICDIQYKMILIADPILDLGGDVGTRLVQKALNAGHAVILCGPYGGVPGLSSVSLPMPRAHQVEEALSKAGYGEERARTLAHKSDGNLASLLRCLQNRMTPEWAEGAEADELAIAVALGSWADSSEADRAAIEEILGKAYAEWIVKIRRAALSRSSPLSQHEGNWRFIARYEGWYALGMRLFDEHLDRLREAAVRILRESDPQFQLPPEDRHVARVSGRVLMYSHLLRNGLAESLALLGSHPNALPSCTPGRATSTAILVMREILSGADWVRWASLNGLLPLLAEAAPGEFLNSVENALRSDPCPFDELFAQEGKGAFGTTYLSGLLWALETLAWDADYLTRVVLTLGELAGRDPGGRWMNRPANSLTTILLPWLPQTCAPTIKRVAAVRVLLAEFPSAGWKLLLSLLPESHSISHGTRRPAWRATIPDGWREGVTHQEYREQVLAYSELTITEAQKNVSRLAELIGRLENLPQPAHDQLLEYLGSDAVAAMPQADRQILWNKLNDLVRKHRRFADAAWAMKPEQVEGVAEIAERLMPADPFLRHQWLFQQGDFDLYEETGDFEEQSRKLEDRRRKAIEEIAVGGNPQAVLEFAKVVEAPWLVGGAYGVVASEEADTEVLPAVLESDQPLLLQFAGRYVRGRFLSQGWKWVDSVDTSKWTTESIGQFLSFLPFTQETWERSRRLLTEDESAYWTKVSAWAFQAESGLEFAIEQLLRYGRPYAALCALYSILHYQQSLDTKLATRALLQALQSTESPHQTDSFYISQIIEALQNHPDTDPDDLFRVEWAYLPLLDEHSRASPKFLERRLREDPSFFCEIIRLVFRSHNEGIPDEEPTEAMRNIASNAYRLLHEWHTPPGLREDGTFDGDVLTEWVNVARQECTETGHLESALIMMGHVLVYVPADPSGLWIHRSAAALLNAKDAEGIRHGYSIELYNLRGAHWVDPTGKPERELAANYRMKAEAVDEAGYPRLAVTLRELADTYEREAEQVRSRELLDD